jgi:5-phospho-D-xylono-1,4-lactonase
MIIRTISADLKPSEIGRVNYHEHAFHTSPLLVNEDLNDLTKSTKEFMRLRESGFESYVDATPIGLGRNMRDILKLQETASLHIIHTTGVHREAHYVNSHPVCNLTIEELTALFKYEIEIGALVNDRQINILQGNTSRVKAGLVKFGIGLNKISSFEGRALDAAAILSTQLGVAIMVHLESGTSAHEVLNKLESFGCDLSKVALAHLDRKPDPSFHVELASRGAMLGHDGAGRSKYFSDSVLIELFKKVVTAGYGSKILLGADVARKSRYIEYGGGPGLEYLGRKFIPELVRATSEEIVNEVLTTNPQGWLAFTPAVTSA